MILTSLKICFSSVFFFYSSSIPFMGLALVVSLSLAACNKSLNLRKLYVWYLLRIFGIASQISASKKPQEDEEGDAVSTSGALISKIDVFALQPPDISYSTSLRNSKKIQELEDKDNTNLKHFNAVFKFDDTMSYIKTGISSVIEDEVTSRFQAEELQSWNLLTRTNQTFTYFNLRLTSVWLVGFIFRYLIALPARLCILIISLFLFFLLNTLLTFFTSSELRRAIYNKGTLIGFRVMSRALSCVIRSHDTQNKPKNDGICVANHTSPIDIIVLSCDRSYALVGQSHGGALGWFQKTLSKGSSHIWFDRSQLKDRQEVSKKLKDHVTDTKKFPICIFPEGTCINNTSVMQFKKGCFEVDCLIYPVAMKYDPRFGDAFWNSSKDGIIKYMINMMTSWAIVVDIWYLPPQKRRLSETAVQFANRVKKLIAEKGGMVDLVWDGNLKRSKAKDAWKEFQQEVFFKKFNQKWD